MNPLSWTLIKQLFWHGRQQMGLFGLLLFLLLAVVLVIQVIIFGMVTLLLAIPTQLLRAFDRLLTDRRRIVPILLLLLATLAWLIWSVAVDYCDCLTPTALTG
ncbi:MAG: hypothetical protein HQL58_02000 [Magnetococcales bacterium]|nr:hypothetical protein [Magnetococcales bacterium]